MKRKNVIGVQENIRKKEDKMKEKKWEKKKNQDIKRDIKEEGKVMNEKSK